MIEPRFTYTDTGVATSEWRVLAGLLVVGSVGGAGLLGWGLLRLGRTWF